MICGKFNPLGSCIRESGHAGACYGMDAEMVKREQARKEFDAAAIEMANIMYVKCGEQGCKDMLCKRVEVIRAAAVTLGLLPSACTCDRTGWPGSASPELHEVNCPARKDGRKS